MEQSNVKKIIKVKEDGTQQECNHCVLISHKDDDFSIEFVDINNYDMVRSVIGFVEALRQIGLGDLLDEMTNYFYSQDSINKECDFDAGLQADNHD